jgi:hypothetical protein
MPCQSATVAQYRCRFHPILIRTSPSTLIILGSRYRRLWTGLWESNFIQQEKGNSRLHQTVEPTLPNPREGLDFTSICTMVRLFGCAICHLYFYVQVCRLARLCSNCLMSLRSSTLLPKLSEGLVSGIFSLGARICLSSKIAYLGYIT